MKEMILRCKIDAEVLKSLFANFILSIKLDSIPEVAVITNACDYDAIQEFLFNSDNYKGLYICDIDTDITFKVELIATYLVKVYTNKTLIGAATFYNEIYSNICDIEKLKESMKLLFPDIDELNANNTDIVITRLSNGSISKGVNVI